MSCLFIIKILLYSSSFRPISVKSGPRRNAAVAKTNILVRLASSAVRFP
jgi:hypothetical protein